MNRPLAILLISALAAVTQAPAQIPANESAKVRFRITRFDPADRPQPLFRAGLDRKVEFEVPLTSIGGPFEVALRDGTFLDLWRASLDKPEISLEIKPDERQDLLLVFFPKLDSFQVLKIRVPLTRIKGGDRFVINTTPSDVSIKLGDARPLVVKPGSSGILAGPGGAKNVNLPALIHRRNGEDWELAGSENWDCDPRFRKFLFIFISPRTRQLAFHGVAERL